MKLKPSEEKSPAQDHSADKWHLHTSPVFFPLYHRLNLFILLPSPQKQTPKLREKEKKSFVSMASKSLGVFTTSAFRGHTSANRLFPKL